MSSGAATTSARPQEIILRNALILVVAQALITPLSVLINAVMARYIGPEDFGHLYLAGTFTTSAFLLVEWGQSGTIPAKVARDHARAGEFLGTGLTWRLSAALVVAAGLLVASWLLHYPEEFRIALALVILAAIVGTMSGACQDTMRGFERTDVSAYGSVGLQFLSAVLVVPTLLLGGRLRATLIAQIVAAVITLSFVARIVRREKVGVLSFSKPTLKSLLHEGSPFLIFGIAMSLQPFVDAAFLSRLAPAEAVGWLAAARRLVGVLVYPASAIITALYPTLCRLHVEDIETYRRTLAGGLRTATLLVVPVALGCALYPDLGIQIFSRKLFGPAEDDLRILSIFVLFVYFSMVLGVGLLAAGRQRAWACVQSLCVVVSLVCDPLLVPWFQAHYGNGGLGICIANVASELLMVVGGIWLTPRGVFDRSLWRELLLCVLAGGAMAGAARLLSGISPFVGAPVSVIVYGACLWATGGVDKDQVRAFRAAISRKVKKRTG